MRSRRALVGIAASLVGVLVAAAPTASADPPTVTWTDPAPTTVSGESGPVGLLRQVQPLQGVAEHSGGVDSVSFTLVEDGAAPGEPCSAARTARPQLVPGRGETRVPFAFDATFPCNLIYVVSAQVTPSISASHGRSDVTRLDLRLLVAIPPADVTGLHADVTHTAVYVQWDQARSPAPDFEGFEVRRAVGAGAMALVSTLDPKTTSYLDSDVSPGATYRYEVVGVRGGPQPGTVVYSANPAQTTADAGPGETTTVPSVGGSGAAVARAPTPTTVRRSTPTTADTGFSEKLPFRRRPTATTTANPLSGTAIATLGGDDQQGGGTRQTMILVAGGANMLAGALVLRFVSRRAAMT